MIKMGFTPEGHVIYYPVNGPELLAKVITYFGIKIPQLAKTQQVLHSFPKGHLLCLKPVKLRWKYFSNPRLFHLYQKHKYILKVILSCFCESLIQIMLVSK